MNSVLQPLVYCPPFLNLFRRLSSVAIPRSPLLDAIAHFTREFKSKTLNAESGQEKWGDPFAPEYVYDVLQKTGRINSKKGRQEDAEEFFGFLLDGLHEEFSTCLFQVPGDGEFLGRWLLTCDGSQC